MTISTKLSSSNFLRQFRTDEGSGSLAKLSSVQFMEVWEHYDRDGNISLILDITRMSPSVAVLHKVFLKRLPRMENVSWP